jgi:hypothetical protein
MKRRRSTSQPTRRSRWRSRIGEARLAFAALIAVLAAVLACPVHAQAGEGRAQSLGGPDAAAAPAPGDAEVATRDDPSASALPTRVGRVANVQGALYHTPGDGSDEWTPIGLNYPVAQDDDLWADRDARAEVDYGGGQFRLAGETNLHVSRLDERQFALFVASGRVIVRVRYLARDDSVRVDTAQAQIALDRPGLYRIDVDANAGETTLLVREGEAAVAVRSGTAQVLPGQMARASGAGDTVDVRNGGGLDGFDTWSAARDRVYEAPRNETYVSREMVGQHDLDSYGQWQTYPEYGAVWFPTVDTEWAPYRFGHWTWLPGWGYAWVDNAPWGYAPFHYGRWAYIAGRWGWCPGAFVARPVWAPALVAWYGGDGFHGGGQVFGWVPLGWGEPFVPWWRGCTSRCYARFNRPYRAPAIPPRGNDARHFVNWSVPGGATAVPVAALTSGRPVAANRVPVAADRRLAPPPLTAPPAVKPAPLRPGAVRPGNGAPLPIANRGIAPLPAAAPPAERRRPAVEPEVRPTPPAVRPLPSVRAAPSVPATP